MTLQVIHGKTSAQLAQEFDAGSAFLTITTYGMVSRIKAFQETMWDCVILDEQDRQSKIRARNRHAKSKTAGTDADCHDRYAD